MSDSGVLRWDEQNRSTLSEALPEALVVLPIGATEQHGPYLPTGTDAIAVTTVVERAAARARNCSRTIVIAPTLAYGASDHHFPFGGTMSLTPETLHAVLLDLARSVVECGGRRLVIVNGHGGNHGVAHSAGAAACNRYDIAVATTDYWRLLPPAPEGGDIAVPGHAGGFETSLMLAVRPELVPDRPARGELGDPGGVPGFDLHSRASWSGMAGFTDDPSLGRPEDGEARLAELADVLGDRLTKLATVL